MSLRYDDIPPQLPKETPRVDPDGSASEYLLESEAAERAWFLGRAQDLNTRVTTVSDGFGDVYAAITNEVTARTNADSALASDITDVQASFGAFTGGGRVAFIATATPTGADSAYEIVVTASDGVTVVETGLKLVANTDGTGFLAIRASGLYVEDPNLPGGMGNVFAYSTTLGAFVFNVPVVVGEREIGQGAANDYDEVNYASPSVVLANGGGTGGAYISIPVPGSSSTLTLDTNTVLFVSGSFAFQTGPSTPGNGGTRHSVVLKINGTDYYIINNATIATATNAGALTTIPIPTQFYMLPAGTYTLEVVVNYFATGSGYYYVFPSQTKIAVSRGVS